MYRPDFSDCAEHFSYCEESGVITWAKPTAHRIKVGAVAGSTRKDGYKRVSFKGGIIAQHRLAWLLHYGDWPDGEIDHINRVRDDNRISNLRVVTSSENHRNREYRKPGEMRHGGKGVSKHKCGKWQVQVHDPRGRRTVYGGLFSNRSSADAKARDMRLEFDL